MLTHTTYNIRDFYFLISRDQCGQQNKNKGKVCVFLSKYHLIDNVLYKLSIWTMSPQIR